jgi:hypothetical protein
MAVNASGQVASVHHLRHLRGIDPKDRDDFDQQSYRRKLVTAGIGKAAYRGVLDASTSPPKERYAVSKDIIIKLIQPGNVDDQLTEILRSGARALLAQAVEAEVADFLGRHADLKTGDGHQRVVRHGKLPEREVLTGIGPVAVRQPRVRDCEAAAAEPGRIRSRRRS